MATEDASIHPGWKVVHLVERVRSLPDARGVPKRRADLIAFLRLRGVDLTNPPNPPAAVESDAPVVVTAPVVADGDLRKHRLPHLLDLARSRPGFKKSVHGKNKTTLIAFLQGGSAQITTSPITAEAVTETAILPASASFRIFEDLETGVRNKTVKRPALLLLAKERGWTKGNKGKIEELLDFIRTRWEIPQPPTEETVTTADTTGQQTWPPLVPLEELEGMSIPQIKTILKRFRISEALPTKKADLIKLFEKKRCNASKLMACEGSQICDLRNDLCRDDLKSRSTKLQEYSFQGRRFWGSSEILEEIRRAVVEREREGIVAPRPPSPDPYAGGVEETKEGGEPPHEHITEPEPEIPAEFTRADSDQGVHPVRISEFMADREAYLRMLHRTLQKTFHVAARGVHIPSTIRSADGKQLRNRFHLTMEENVEELA